MTTYYTSYVRHCLRFYARHPNPEFRNDIDRLNWEVCDKVLGKMCERNRKIILEIYGSTLPVVDNVYTISERDDYPQNKLWSLLNYIEISVAKERGLYAN